MFKDTVAFTSQNYSTFDEDIQGKPRVYTLLPQAPYRCRPAGAKNEARTRCYTDTAPLGLRIPHHQNLLKSAQSVIRAIRDSDKI